MNIFIYVIITLGGYFMKNTKDNKKPEKDTLHLSDQMDFDAPSATARKKRLQAYRQSMDDLMDNKTEAF